MLTNFGNIWQKYSFTNGVYSDIKIACPTYILEVLYLGKPNTIQLHFYNICLSLTAIIVSGKTNMLSTISQYRNNYCLLYTSPSPRD